MHDQADVLRRLVIESCGSHAADRAARPAIIVLSGAKGGVGTTTLAVGLAVQWARQGHRCLLVDADGRAPDAALLCGLDPHEGLADVLTGRRTLHEVLRPGPLGLQVLAGPGAARSGETLGPAAVDRLVMELSRVGRHADLVVVDAGAGCGTTSAALWQAADQLLLVTTTDDLAVMDAYAAIKLAASRRAASGSPAIGLLVNRAENAAAAADVRRRLNQACRRFLGFEPQSAGWCAEHAGMAAWMRMSGSTAGRAGPSEPSGRRNPSGPRDLSRTGAGGANGGEANDAIARAMEALAAAVFAPAAGRRQADATTANDAAAERADARPAPRPAGAIG